jgi:hypothetical protein
VRDRGVAVCGGIELSRPSLTEVAMQAAVAHRVRSYKKGNAHQRAKASGMSPKKKPRLSGVFFFSSAARGNA